MAEKNKAVKDAIVQKISELMKSGKTRAQALAIARTESAKSTKHVSNTQSHQRDLIPEPDTDTVAFIVYTVDDKILWLRRSKDDTWDFPGGHLEKGESAIEGAIRESREEIGHVPVTGIQHIFHKDNIHLFQCDDGEFVPDLNPEHTEYIWATIEDAPFPLFDKIDEDAEEIAEKAAAAMDKREWDTNGWFEVAKNPLSKVGVFPYRGASIAPECDPNKLYNVLRSAEALSNPDTMQSLRLIPWINDHVMLGSEEDGLMPVEQKGMQGMTGEQVEFENNTLFCNIKVVSEAMKNLIESGKEELSLGYKCAYLYRPGIFNGIPYEFEQIDIRFNHLALVERGRMGADVRVLDHDDILNRGPAMAKSTGANGSLREKFDALKTQVLAFGAALDADESRPDGDTERGGKEDGEKLLMAKDDDSEKKKALDADKEKDCEDDEEKKKSDSAMDAAEIAKTVHRELNEKAKLYGKLSAVVGSFDHDEMSLGQLVKYGCQKLKIEVSKSERKAALEGYLMAQPARVGTMDSAHTQGRKGSFVDAYLKGELK